MDCAFLGYPISAGFRDRFERAIGASPQYVGLPELRRLSPAALIRRLAGISARRAYILLEDESSRPILPILQTLASFSRAGSLEVVHGNLQRERFSRLGVVPELLHVGAASLAGHLHVRKSRAACRALLSEARTPFPFGTANRVLYLKTNLWFGVKAGGSVGHVAGVVNGMLSHGLQVDYYGPEVPAMVDPEASFHQLNPPRYYGLPVGTNLFRFGHDIVRQVMATAQQQAYDFIYQRMSIANFSGVELSRRLRLPLVLEYNGSEVWAQKNWGKAVAYSQQAQLAEDVCLRHSQLIVTVSDVLRDELVGRGVEPERVVSYPNCIDPRVFNPERFSEADHLALRHSLGIAPDAKVALFLGTFGQWHGVPVLAQAVARLVAEKADWLRKHRVFFLFVGDGTTMPEVRQTLASPACEPFHKLLGLVPQAEAPAYLAMANILLSPHVDNPDGTRFFGSPTKLFEYMAMSRGIYASRLQQIGEVLHNSLDVTSLPTSAPDEAARQVAVLGRPGNVDDLIRGIEFLVERPDWCSKLGGNARAEALRKYTWQHHVQAILNGRY